MPQPIPVPRDGAQPTPEGAARPRPWPGGRRLFLPFLTAAFVLAPAGHAMACTERPKPPCNTGRNCHPVPTRPTAKPAPSRPHTPTAKPAPSRPHTPTAIPTATPTPTPKETGGDCEGGSDTCGVVTGSPDFTG